MLIESLIPKVDLILLIDSVGERKLAVGKPSEWTYYTLQLRGFFEVKLLQVVRYCVVVAFALLIVLFVLILGGNDTNTSMGRLHNVSVFPF